MELLGRIGFAQQTRNPFIKDHLVMTCWVCLSIVAGWRLIQEVPSLVDGAKFALEMLEKTDTCDEQLDSLTRVPKVIGTFDMAWRFLIELSVALGTEEEHELAEVQEILHNHESQISELEGIDIISKTKAFKMSMRRYSVSKIPSSDLLAE